MLGRVANRCFKRYLTNERSLGLRRFEHFQRSGLHTLIIGEPSNNGGNVRLSDATYSSVVAAKELGSDNQLSMLIASESESTNETLINEASCIDGINQIITYNNANLANLLPEFISDVIVECHNKHSFSHIMAGISSFSRDVLPRVAGILDISQISDITKVLSDSTFERPMYAGNAICKVESKEALKIITTRLTSFQFNKDELTNNGTKNESVNIINETFDNISNDNYNNKLHVSDELSSNEGPSLQSASIVISGGRGMQNGENFEMLYKLSKLFGDCAVGASRAAVDAGFVSNDLQVGQTGKVVAPNLYVAVGISGAIQHIAGMKDSKVIVAINKDEEAPIFSIADYGLKADLFEAVPALTEKMQ